MKTLIYTLISLIIFHAGTAHADVCFTSFTSDQAALGDFEDPVYANIKSNETDGFLDYARLTCTEANDHVKQMAAVSMLFQAGAFYAACTGVGAPVSILLEGGALIYGGAAAVVSMLPCTDADTEAKIKRLARDEVCQAMADLDMDCNVPLDRVKVE